MGNSINEEYFNCIAEDNINNKTINIINKCDTYIGYGSKKVLYAIRSLSIISFILNFIFLIFQFLKLKRSEKNKKNVMKTLFQILPLFDCIISLYWIISSFYFSQANDIKNSIGFCSFLSVFYQICFTFQFVMINGILIFFKKINLSPMEGLMKPNRDIFIYICISLIISLVVGIFSLFTSIGRSPMNTCFINNIDSGGFSLIFLIPIIFIIFAIGQILLDLCCKDLFITDRGIRIMYKKNSYYVLIFCFLHFPMICFFLHTAIVEEDLYEINEDTYKTYSSIISLFTSMIPLIIGLIRYLQKLSKIDCIKNFLKNNKANRARVTRNLERSNSIREDKNISLLIENDPYGWLEKHTLECFMRDILIGIASSLKRSKKYGKNIFLKNGGNSMDYEKYSINFGVLGEYDFGDETINKSDYLKIKVVNFAPESFAYLRQLENINIDEMIQSFLPKNNTQGIKKSQGKSGSFFISTDDNKYMVKSLKSEEIDLIRNGFLSRYIKHIEKTKNESLLCRLYGMYNIMMTKKQEFLIIVMRNVIGDLKDNIVAQYDLKGSSYKRKASFDMDKINKTVLKDNNFDEIEKYIMLSENNANKLRDIVEKDSQFLSESLLMDYSLFLIKLTLNKEESADIFGENIKEYQNKAVTQLFNNKNSNNKIKIENEEMNNIEIMNDNMDINEEIKRKKGKGNLKDIRYYNQYLFPSLREGFGYILSIIDYFQFFNFRKVVEANVISKFKTGFNKEKNNTISCVNPGLYSSRFIKYFKKITNISEVKDISKDIMEEKYEEEKENNIDNEHENINKLDKNLSEEEEINYEIKENYEINLNVKMTKIIKKPNQQFSKDNNTNRKNKNKNKSSKKKKKM